jgi:hypothetical protein
MLQRNWIFLTLVVNDLCSATYGEWIYGSGKNVDDLVVLFIGTGIGSGVLASIHDLVHNVENLIRKNALEATIGKLEFAKAKLGKMQA